MWFVSRRRHEEELADALARAEQLRAERDTARAERATAIRNRRQIGHQLAEADAALKRLAGRNTELPRRLEQDTDHDVRLAEVTAINQRCTCGGAS